jgi:iron uptake system component EfeO
MRRTTLLPLALAASLLAVTACGSDDDGEAVREIGTEDSASASGSSADSGSSAASGSGSAIADAAGSDAGTDDAVLVEAVAAYESYVRTQVEQLLEDATVFTDAVRAGDVEAAQAAYAPSRQAWERIDPVASLIEELDGKLDARVDDFTDENDPAWTGWHRLEYLLWEVGTLDESATALADQMDADLLVLQEEVAALEIPPAVIAVGSMELLEEAANGKLTGEEDRYSHTDLWDIAANIDGSEQAFELLEAAVAAKDPELVEHIEAEFAEARELLEAQRDGDGYVGFDTLTEAEINEMKAVLAELAEELSEVAGVLGLE